MSIQNLITNTADLRIARTAVFGVGVSLCEKLIVEDQVVIEKGVIFVDSASDSTIVRSGARIGAGSVIGPGVEIGTGSTLEPGSVVLQSVPANSIVRGNPAQIIGYTKVFSRVPAEKIICSTLFLDSQSSSTATLDLGVGSSKLYTLPHIQDMRGSLTVGEFDERLPFRPKRYFMVFDVPSEELRGEHAHKLCHQFLVCVKGSCTALIDDGSARIEVVLNKLNVGLYMPPMIWGTQFAYSRDAILLVFASHHYENSDYIRSYSEFLSIVGAGCGDTIS